MNYPLLYFVDCHGERLPEKDGYQYCQQFNGRIHKKNDWYLQTEGDWDNKVGLIDESGVNIFILEIDEESLIKKWRLPLLYKGKNEVRKERDKRRKEIAGGAGWTTAVLLDSDFKPVPNTHQARLWVSPSSLSEADLSEIVAEIGLLALSVGSVFSYPPKIYQGEQTGEELGHNTLPDGQLLTTPKALLALYNLVRNLWAEIEKRPLRSFKQEISPVDITRNINSPQTIIARKLRPSKKQMLAVSSVESLDCSENQFLCYVLDSYLKDLASGLIKLIEEFDSHPPSSNKSIQLIPQKSSKTHTKISSFWEEARKKSTEFSSKFARGKEHRLEILAQLNECIQWSKDIRCKSFLKDIITPNSPCLSSQRLIKSPKYGLILAAYNNCNGSHLHSIDKVIRLYRETLRSEVRATSQIYEIWCFVKIYSALATQLKLTPPINTKSLFESIKLIDREMLVPTNQEFKLQGTLADGNNISVSFWYDTDQNYFAEEKIKHFTPDIKLKICINNRDKIYYLDAKYKNYQTMKGEFFRDVIGIAKNKYLEKLEPTACFVLHPDREFDFWGEIPFATFIKDKFTKYKLIEESQGTDETDYIGHKYGAIVLTPGVHADTQINKLIRLIFQYHDDLYFTCLDCGCEAEQQPDWIPDYLTKEELVRRIVQGRSNNAIYCSCKQCGDFWVVQRCQANNQHRLLKFWKSFHKRSDRYPNNLIYMCPECGNDPDFSKQLNYQ